jgi:hypothetical protein
VTTVSLHVVERALAKPVIHVLCTGFHRGPEQAGKATVVSASRGGDSGASPEMCQPTGPRKAGWVLGSTGLPLAPRLHPGHQPISHGGRRRQQGLWHCAQGRGEPQKGARQGRVPLTFSLDWELLAGRASFNFRLQPHTLPSTENIFCMHEKSQSFNE